MSNRTVIWFDAASPPQVLWFSGLAQHFEDNGFALLITARSQADTADIARRFLPRLDAVIEGHDPGPLSAKLFAIGNRARRLRDFVRGRDPGRILAISHNSYAQLLAARSLRIPALTSMDFEGQSANHLAFRLANRVLLPEAFPTDVARRQGARSAKLVRYPGVKEAVYLASFNPPHLDEGRPQIDGQAFAVVRPEADFATYQAGANPLFPAVLDHLVSCNARVLLLPRGEVQREQLAQRWGVQVEIPEGSLDGPALLAQADIFVGAGGTMTREAAMLGTDAYSIYWGQTPAVDLYLEQMGHLRILRDVTDVAKLEVRIRTDRSPPRIGSETRESVLAAIDDFVDVYA